MAISDARLVESELQGITGSGWKSVSQVPAAAQARFLTKGTRMNAIVNLTIDHFRGKNRVCSENHQKVPSGAM
jgi:hypothetical protein